MLKNNHCHTKGRNTTEQGGMIVNQEQRELLALFMTQIPENHKSFYNDLIDFNAGLGYTPVKTKTASFNLDFKKNKIKQTILKLECPSPSSIHPLIRMKFYAAQSYGGVFKDSLRKVIEDHGGRYTGCYGCGRCNGQLQGYTYEYADGRKVFRCGGELIPIPNATHANIDEIKRLITEQDMYWMKLYSQK